MYRLALLGRDISSYTLSPRIHAAVARAIGVDIDFKTVDIPFDCLEHTVAQLMRECDGFFVTKPYKNTVKRYVAATNPICGVNVVRSRDGVGFDTDGEGFLRAVNSEFGGILDIKGDVLVLGAGGAAYSVVHALVGTGKNVYVLDRTLMNAAKLCNATGAKLYVNQPAELVVNCTSAGLNGEDVLSALCVLPDFAYAYDLVYSRETPFLRRCENAGARCAGGLSMLIYQAILGDGLILGENLNVDDVYKKVRESIKCDGGI